MAASRSWTMAPTRADGLATLNEPKVVSRWTNTASAPCMVRSDLPDHSIGWPKPTTRVPQTAVTVPMPAAVMSP